jgi:hypothetical protein
MAIYFFIFSFERTFDQDGGHLINSSENISKTMQDMKNR